MKIIMLGESEVAWMEAETPEETAWIEAHAKGTPEATWGEMVCAWAREHPQELERSLQSCPDL